jgi:hypothetical protein
MLFPETNKVFKTELISLKRKIVFKISRNDVCVFCRCNNEDKNNRDASSVGVNPHLCRERKSSDLAETHTEAEHIK